MQIKSDSDEVNALIIEQLMQYDEQIRDLALAAIRLSERQSAPAVIDQMVALLRKSVRDAGGSK